MQCMARIESATEFEFRTPEKLQRYTNEECYCIDFAV